MSAPAKSGSSFLGWMQSTGQTSTHSPDFTPTHGSAMMRVIPRPLPRPRKHRPYLNPPPHRSLCQSPLLLARRERGPMAKRDDLARSCDEALRDEIARVVRRLEDHPVDALTTLLAKA